MKLCIVWTNPSFISFEKMVAMYSVNALKYGWWDEVVVVVWGEPAKLVAEDEAYARVVKDMIANGVRVSACKACSDQLGVSDNLKELGIEVIYWGIPLTEALKSSDTKVIVV